MESLLNLHALNLFLFFIVPGFVALSVHDLIIPASRRNLSEAAIQIISFSMINLVLWIWLIDWMGRSNLHTMHPVRYYLMVVGIVGISPATLAAATIGLRKSSFLRGKVLHPAPTGWDFFFGRRTPCFVLCRLKSGGLFGGYFGTRSFASAFPSPEEIYLEQVWHINDLGEFDAPVAGSAGIIVRMDDCEIIELFEAEE